METLLTVLVPIAAVILIVICAKRIAARPFQCSHCGGVFRIHWTKVLVTTHADNDYLLVCPYCKTKDHCKQESKQKTDL